MNAHQRRVHKRESTRAFQRFRTAGIPPEQARHWADARATRMVEANYDPERPIKILHWLRMTISAAPLVAAAALGVLLIFLAT